MTAAATIRDALRCGRSGCACATSRGNVHCPVPAHGQGRGDQNPSLSVDLADSGTLLVHCFTGCSQEDVISVLRSRALWPEAGTAAGAPRQRRQRTGDRAGDGDGGKPERKSQATRLVALATGAGARLFHDPDGTAYASIPGVEHREIWAVRSSGFRRWLQSAYFLQEQNTVSAQAIQDAIGVLEGLATFPPDAPEYPVHIRIAGAVDGPIYLDLVDARWRVAVAGPDGWAVTGGATCPPKFRRARGMLPFPTPQRGGSLEELRPFLNVGSDTDWRLAVAWLLGALRPSGPYPILALHGEQGSAKTTTARVLRALIDPSTAPVRAEPRDGRDLMIAARNGWVVALDNLSSVPGWLSDALCRLSTGGGFATRTLYSDDEETIFDAQRPIILTGITELTTRADLLDRSIVLYLPSIPAAQRKPESEFWADFETARPRILGALLDAAAGALRELPATRLERLPRMADFALWATAAEPALGWEPGAFMAGYAENRAGANDLALEASPVGEAVRALAAECASDGWRGTASDLLATLTPRLRLPDGKKPPQGWPANGRALSNALRRIAPNLRAAGVDVDFGRVGKARQRLITLRLVEQAGDFASAASFASAQEHNTPDPADATTAGRTQDPDPADANPPKLSGAQARMDAKDAADARIPVYSHEARATEREEMTL